MEGDETNGTPMVNQMISIHTLRMEGDPEEQDLYIIGGISIHTLRMEGDLVRFMTTYSGDKFQSTPSAWRVTILVRCRRPHDRISIHTLRMEGDF